ncbi:MAG: aryl-sulfate sulfotransferase [Planctomycetes bacterium]|nr:aryl-sulfate sulfotransferase [Planctomycetota bacterium]
MAWIRTFAPALLGALLVGACGASDAPPPSASSDRAPSAPRPPAPAVAPAPAPAQATDASPAVAAAPVASEPARGLRLRAAGACDGLTIVAPLNSRSVHLVDLDGAVVHTWRTARLNAGGTYLLPGARLLRLARDEARTGSSAGGISGLIQELDWDGRVLWECSLAEHGLTAHHDLEPLANGNVMVVAREFHDHAAGLARGRDPSLRRTSAVWSDVIVEVEPVRPSGSRIVWTWRAWDHLVQDFDPKAQGYGRPADHPGRIDLNADHRYLPKQRVETPEARARRERLERQMAAVGYAGGELETPPAPPPRVEANPLFVAPEEPPGDGRPDPRTVPGLGEDWLHVNSIDVDEELGLIALSSPRLSEVLVIERTPTTAEAAAATGGRYGRGGDLLYRWGNPQSYGRGGPAERRLWYQHDATWLSREEGSLRFLVFNNGQRRAGGEHSSVEEVHVPFDARTGFALSDGAAFQPLDAAWTYADPPRFYAGFISGAQRLPNGNTLVCEGTTGRLFEVTRAGAIVWEYWNPLDDPGEGLSSTGAVFMAIRIPKDDPRLTR